MAFGLTAAAVAEYVSLPFVRHALTHPRSPASVLSFFFGVDYSKPSIVEEINKGDFLRTMTPFWFGGHEDYDKICRESFAELVRDAGRKKLSTEPEWTSTVDGQMAQLILCDQLSRNAFRGHDEAYAYDETALEVSKLLASECIFHDDSTTPPSLEGTFCPPYATILATALMHSESVADHELNEKVLEWAVENSPESLKETWWDNQKKHADEHKAVVDRFGRYPHRNTKKGRTSTPEELEWLANVDELPMWAKSQL